VFPEFRSQTLLQLRNIHPTLHPLRHLSRLRFVESHTSNYPKEPVAANKRFHVRPAKQTRNHAPHPREAFPKNHFRFN
jgi:hypothetical protein